MDNKILELIEEVGDVAEVSGEISVEVIGEDVEKEKNLYCEYNFFP
jgi:hypothetical protein